MRDLESIKRDYNIVDIARRLSIEVRSDNKAICPFHDDRTPSLSFNTRDNYYYCFACGAGGDNVKLVMKMLNYNFKEALEFITGNVNNKRKLENISHGGRRIVENYTAVYQYFINILDEHIAVEYLSKRRITESQVKKHSIKGLPKDKDAQKKIVNMLLAEFSEDTLLKSGIVAKSKNYNLLYLTHYKHRLILPYFDEHCNIVAIQGRAIDEGIEPKYLLNKYATDSVYNIENLTCSVRDIVLCEGVIDALSLERLGFKSIAISGATKHKLIYNSEILKKYNIYVFSDEDKAGESLVKSLYRLENFKGKFLYEKFTTEKSIKDINELLCFVEIKSFKVENKTYNYFLMPDDKICILDYYVFTKSELEKISKYNFENALLELIRKKNG